MDYSDEEDDVSMESFKSTASTQPNQPPPIINRKPNSPVDSTAAADDDDEVVFDDDDDDEGRINGNKKRAAPTTGTGCKFFRLSRPFISNALNIGSVADSSLHGVCSVI